MGEILIVDDSEVVRAQLKKDLEKAGYTVVPAGDGVEGLEELKKEWNIRLILADVNMPNMDGLTMCEKVRQMSKYEKTPILMLTTETNEEMKTKAKSIGVRAWIRKPYDATKLIHAIQTLLKN